MDNGFNHYICGFCYVPPRPALNETEKARFEMSCVLRTINSFEDLGFEVLRDSVELEPGELDYNGLFIAFRFRPTDKMIPVHGV